VSRVDHKSECVSFTKGYVKSLLFLSGHVFPLVVYNVHMPFKSLKDTENFYSLLKKDYQVYDSPVFVVGDLNSRSLLTTECYSKNVQRCLSMQTAKQERSLRQSNAYCTVVKYLESLSLDHTLSFSSTSKYPRFSKDDCTSWERVLPRHLTKGQLRDLLLQTDLILQSKTLFAEFQEAPILFLPTYKRNPTTGTFLLSKKENGRLPGYADRVLFKESSRLSIVTRRYTSLPLTGNDHLPLFGLYTIKEKRDKKKSRKVG
jgi:hypothetical protein